MEVEMRAVGVRWYLDPMKAQGYGFGHEYLVVDLRTPGDEQVLIRAEKDFAGMGDEKYPPGGLISITRIEDPLKFAKENENGLKYPADLQGSGKILMKDLIDILGACDTRYSWWKHNCWKYGKFLEQIFESVVGRLADTSKDCKEKICVALSNMPYPTLPVDILEEAGSTLLAVWVLLPLTYWGAVGAIAAFKFLRGLKMALAAGTTVKGLAVYSLFTSKSSTDLVIESLA